MRVARIRECAIKSQFDCSSGRTGRADSGRILMACQNPSWVIIDPVNAARFMTAASISSRRARSAALNVPCVAKSSRIGTRLGFLDIGSLPVQLRNPNDRPSQNALANQLAKSIIGIATGQKSARP